MADQPQQNRQPENEQQAPQVPEEELKMPTEPFRSGTDDTGGPFSNALIPILVGVLVLVLGMFGALILWGDQIIDTFFPSGEPTVEEETSADDGEATTTDTTETSSSPQNTTANDDSLSAIESDLESTSFNSFNEDMEEIDTTLEATSTGSN